MQHCIPAKSIKEDHLFEHQWVWSVDRATQWIGRGEVKGIPKQDYSLQGGGKNTIVNEISFVFR